MSEELKCEKLIRKTSKAPNNQGKYDHWNERCNLPAARYKIGGLLGVAIAVLCERHKKLADDEAFVSKQGWPKGKISKDAKEHNYVQERLPDTGVREKVAE